MAQRNGSETFQEILTQTNAWSEAIEITDAKAVEIKALNIRSYQQVLFIGCGSTYYLSLSAASLFQSLTGVLARAFPSSELILFPESVFSDGKILLVAISRSGTTSETLHAVRKFKENQLGDVIVITNDSASPLAKIGDISIAINEGQEKSVAQTRSFSSMFVAITALTFLLGTNETLSKYKDSLIATGNRLLEKYEIMSRTIGEDHTINQIFYLGSGPRFGLANEVSLKLKEMSQTITQPFHFFEFRHGPISMVDDRSLVVGLMSDNEFNHEKAVMEDVAKFGSKTLMIGEHGPDIAFNSRLPENTRNVLFLPALQLLAYYRAVGYGKNPDKPRNITSVVELDSSRL